jgi:hypothetical protein
MEGYVKLHRKLLESAVFHNDKALKVFIWCLLRATYTPRDIMVGNRKVHLEPGQFVTGRKRAADELQMPEGTVYDVITTLKNQQQIMVHPNNKYSLVTVVNWALYQVEAEESNNKNGSPPTTNQQQTNTNKKDKNTSLVIDPTGATPAPANDAPMAREWELYYIKLNAYLEAKRGGVTMAYPEPPGGTGNQRQEALHG